ncbi:hypothetical protein AVEN_209049-1 [Araneus ventricosus]|uniref:Uncharacterized protein n=1 Tax=Araneus ventricosus TaxID=182803 RepID=A0A4Y2KJR0_ARAVE|nr:hypothetical protein AVEN_209049-1 [Araneus ventricosus]
MAVGDGTPGATTNSGVPAGIFRIMGGSKDNTRGSSSIGALGATASSGGPARYSFAGHQLRGISRGSSLIRRVGDGTPGTTATSGRPVNIPDCRAKCEFEEEELRRKPINQGEGQLLRTSCSAERLSCNRKTT